MPEQTEQEVKLEDVLKEMHDLSAAVTASKSDPATFDFDKVKEVFGDEIEKLVALQVAAKLDAAPARKGDPVWANDLSEQAVAKENRYANIGNGLIAAAKDNVDAIRYDGVNYKAIDLMLAQALLGTAHEHQPERQAAPSQDLQDVVKAMASGSSGFGAELLMTDMARSLWDDMFLAARVAGLVGSIPLPSSPFDIPLGLGDVIWRKGTENTAASQQSLTTSNITFTVTELLAHIGWSYSLDEDAVVAMMPNVRANLSRRGSEIIDDFLLNADSVATATGNVNLDDAAPPDDTFYLSDGQDGIRKQWIVDNTNMSTSAGAALADAKIVTAMGTMGKYAADPSKLVIVTDVATYLAGWLGLDGVETWEKFGPEFVLKAGTLAAYRGIPIVVSAQHPKGEADGKVSTTAGSNTKGSFSLFVPAMWKMGFVRNLLVEIDRDIQKRQFIVVASMRPAVGCHGTRSSNTHTAGVYNITV